jgi:hypothetical protein
MVYDLAGLLLIDGQIPEAGTELDRMDLLVSGTDEGSESSHGQRLRGMMHAASGDLGSAERWFETAIATARRQSARLFELQATTNLAEILAAQGRQGEGARRLSRAYESFRDGLQAPDVRTAKMLLERLS